MNKTLNKTYRIKRTFKRGSVVYFETENDLFCVLSNGNFRRESDGREFVIAKDWNPGPGCPTVFQAGNLEYRSITRA